MVAAVGRVCRHNVRVNHFVDRPHFPRPGRELELRSALLLLRRAPPRLAVAEAAAVLTSARRLMSTRSAQADATTDRVMRLRSIATLIVSDYNTPVIMKWTREVDASSVSEL